MGKGTDSLRYTVVWVADLLVSKFGVVFLGNGEKKALTPENHYLWLCEYHTRAYKV